MRHKRKNNNNKENPPFSKGKAPIQNLQNPQNLQHIPKKGHMVVGKDQCMNCYKTGHYKKDCHAYLKMMLSKRGENIISQIDESLYTDYSKSTWWIDSGATVHVANSLQDFLSMRITRGERTIKVTIDCMRMSKQLEIFS